MGKLLIQLFPNWSCSPLRRRKLVPHLILKTSKEIISQVETPRQELKELSAPFCTPGVPSWF